MKQKVFWVLFVLIPSLGFSQTYSQGTRHFNVGLNSEFGYGIGLVTAYDVAVQDNMSLGVFGLLDPTYNSRGRRTMGIVGGGRFSYHFGEYLFESTGFQDEKLDMYGGISVGLRLVGRDYYNGILPVGLFVGLRYEFKEKNAVLFEAGYPFNAIGLSFRL